MTRCLHLPCPQGLPPLLGLASKSSKFSRWAQIVGTEADWNIKSVPCPQLDGRELELHRGKYVVQRGTDDIQHLNFG